VNPFCQKIALHNNNIKKTKKTNSVTLTLTSNIKIKVKYLGGGAYILNGLTDFDQNCTIYIFYLKKLIKRTTFCELDQKVKD